MIWRILPVFVVVVVLIFLAQLPLQAQSEPPIFRAPLQPLTTSKRGVVFKAALAREFGRQCSRASPSGWWTPVAPSKIEIRRLEAALPAWMKTIKEDRWSKRFSDFYFQYGALVRGKKRLIYVNAVPSFSEDKKQLWRRGAAMVCDGGPNFWGIEFDVRSGRFQNASFNGPR